MLPAYFSNMAPIIVKKINILVIPVDSGKKIAGEPIFGKNKTWRGLVAGTLFGIIIAFIQSNLDFGWNLIDYNEWLLIGTMMGFGAIFGDLMKSFIKRRFKVQPGHKFFPWDQLDFAFGSLLFSFFLFPQELTTKIVITVLIISPILHIIVNHLAFYLKIRNEKW
jgi:CDP-2,3-bis-(O-geranylgeranyl)-sn-glycerol synthase